MGGEATVCMLRKLLNGEHHPANTVAAFILLLLFVGCHLNDVQQQGLVGSAL